ncbi:MAG: hypothetical protein QOE33_909 [Acidobacteriota bacterium]|nr:hypothetical protein [Acidobacteriota bacterium]
MKKKSDALNADLRPEYDSSILKGGVRGKHLRRYREGTNLVLLAPEVAKVFPDDESVNEALRLLMKVSKKQSPQQRSSKRS